MAQSTTKKPRELTGRAVIIWFVCFFGLVFAVNGVLVKAATSTFGGLETSSSYKAGLMFKQEEAAAAAQAARGWRVDGKLIDRGGEAVLDVAVRDANGAVVPNLTASARLAHPANATLDHDVTLAETGPGTFHGVAQAEPGQWELILDFERNGERMFRSRSRVTLK